MKKAVNVFDKKRTKQNEKRPYTGDAELESCISLVLSELLSSLVFCVLHC